MTTIWDDDLGRRSGTTIWDDDLAARAVALREKPADGGLWTGAKVAAWMSARLGRPISPKLGLDDLHRLGFSLQRPRPCHTAVDAMYGIGRTVVEVSGIDGSVSVWAVNPRRALSVPESSHGWVRGRVLDGRICRGA